MIPGSANPLLLASAVEVDVREIDRSVRFNSSDSAYLSKIFGTPTTQNTWTFSCWIKLCRQIADNNFRKIFGLAANNNGIFVYNDTITLNDNTNNNSTVAVFRDYSAWYHLLIRSNGSANTVFVNGVQQTLATTNCAAGLGINTATEHRIGKQNSGFAGALLPLDAYLADIHFIDGQALDPTSFGEFDDNGIWQPIEYTGTYGTNGFHLPFSDNTTAAALGTDTSGNGNDWTPYNLQVFTGGPTSVASASGALPIYNTTDTYGTTKGTGTRTDGNSSSIVLALPMDGTNGGTTFTDESATIKGSGSAKTATATNATTSTAQSKFYGSSGYFDGATSTRLTYASSADFAFGTGAYTLEAWIYATSYAANQGSIFDSGNTNGAFDFFLASNGALGIGIYGTGNLFTTSSSAVALNRWVHVTVTRSSTGTNDTRIYVDGLLATTGTDSTNWSVTTTPSVGGIGIAGYSFAGYIQDLRVYKGVAKYTSNFNPPSSTQNATIAAGNDSLVDVPTNGTASTGGDAGGVTRGNYCTWNPLINGDTAANGNLDVTNDTARGTQNLLNFDAYWEITSTGGTTTAGVVSDGGTTNTTTVADTKTYGFKLSAAGSLDYINITDGGSFTNITTGLTGVQFPYASAASATTGSLNAGQRPFAAAAPAGFKGICTANLPTPVVTKPSEYMDVKLYTGNGSTQTISGLEFSPDLVWIKNRAAADSHKLTDTVRGATKELDSDIPAVEAINADGLTAFNSDGFDLGADAEYNTNTEAYVAWCWDAGSSTVTNTDGSISSQVRANASAGFSIVTYIGNGTAGATIGHGLGVAPEMIIVKNRDQAYAWQVYHAANTANPETDYLLLNNSAATADALDRWNDTAPGASVFTLGDGAEVNTNTEEYIAYCFTGVSGYTAMSSYTGNGNADGPFVFTNMRPRWILIKRTDTASNGIIIDTAREGYNVDNDPLFPNLSNAEGTTDLADILSNGFKLRTTDASVNANTGTYIYFAIAEAALNYARAR